jgi:hypothetical protein
LKQYEKFSRYLRNELCSNNLTDFGLKKGLDHLEAVREKFQVIVGGWTAKDIHQAVITAFGLSPKAYGLNQLRYDLRKLKGHALLQRDGSRYAYRLTTKGVEVALLFLFFHKRLCGPLANSRFHHRPDRQHRPNSRLETAYHRADKAIEEIVNLLAAA